MTLTSNIPKFDKQKSKKQLGLTAMASPNLAPIYFEVDSTVSHYFQ